MITDEKKRRTEFTNTPGSSFSVNPASSPANQQSLSNFDKMKQDFYRPVAKPAQRPAETSFRISPNYGRGKPKPAREEMPRFTSNIGGSAGRAAVQRQKNRYLKERRAAADRMSLAQLGETGNTERVGIQQTGATKRVGMQQEGATGRTNLQQAGADSRQELGLAVGQENALDLGEQKQGFALENLRQKAEFDKESDIRKLGISAALAGSTGPQTRNLIDYQRGYVTPTLEGVQFHEPQQDKYTNIKPTLDKNKRKVLSLGGAFNANTGEFTPREQPQQEQAGPTMMERIFGGVKNAEQGQGQPSYNEDEYLFASNVMKGYDVNNPDPEQKKYIDSLYEQNPDLVNRLFQDYTGAI